MIESTFKILIADDHKLFSEGLASMVKQIKGTELTGIASNGQEALDLIILNPIDLLITDLHMPGMDGLELIRNVKQKYPNIKILVISMHNEPSVIEEVFDANAEGYILKDATREEFLKAIDRILYDGTYYSNIVLENLLRQSREKRNPRKTKFTYLSGRLKFFPLSCKNTPARKSLKSYSSANEPWIHTGKIFFRKHIVALSSGL